MIKVIDIEESDISASEMYTTDKYPHSGFFLIKENGCLMHASINGTFKSILYFGVLDNLVFRNEKVEAKSEISEQLFLKTISILTNKNPLNLKP